MVVSSVDLVADGPERPEPPPAGGDVKGPCQGRGDFAIFPEYFSVFVVRRRKPLIQNPLTFSTPLVFLNCKKYFWQSAKVKAS
jgi:hypothetical protein